MTKALNRVLGEENGAYRDICTVEFIPLQELTDSGKNPMPVGYLYTGVLLIRDSMIIPVVTKDDFVVKVGVPPRTTKRMIDRFCAVKLPFLWSDADSCDATDDSILADQQLLDKSLERMALVNDALLSREELKQRYELEQARYR